MSHKGRASGNCPERSNEELERSGVACAAGDFPLRFAIDHPGRFVAYRGEMKIGGIEFKSGGWIAYELRNGRPSFTPHGRIKARFAAFDLWGEVAAGQVGLLPDNRSQETPRENGALLRREIERGTEGAP